MVDIIIAVFVLLFLYLGYREGLAKTAGTIILAFVALFVATTALTLLAKASPELSNPANCAGLQIFFGLWFITYIILDVILGLLLRKIVTVTILGPIDKFAGLALGGFKGMLIAGIILQLYFCFPLAETTKKTIADSSMTKLSIMTYHWAYPYAKRWSKYLGEFGRENMLEKVQGSGNVPVDISAEAEKLKKANPGELLKNIDEYNEAVIKHDKELMKILDEQKLLEPTPPARAR
ncbi:MAG: CvpA family protein [Candidatus Margulisbacteria bacterium]|nr:CvpA family protein [Candidatus Margulisiibacteriota bacterium]